MKQYKCISGNSGVSGYQLEVDHIDIMFQDGRLYTYSYRIAGRDHVEKMKDLAESGQGLTTYINKYVSELYDR